MEITRILEQKIIEMLTTSHKAIILYGPRQVGKTTLCRKVIEKLPYKTLTINADQPRYSYVLASKDSRQLGELVAGYDLLFIDEAQHVPEIGVNLKIIIDQIPSVKILATGSSSFDLAKQVGEPLIGRKWTYTLYPIAQLELTHHYNHFELKSDLEQRLIWGSYPELFQLAGQERKYAYLQELISGYLYRDILELGGIKHPKKIHRLLTLIAYQIGQQVSLSELGTQLELSKKTVAHYLELLEKTFVIFPLSGFSRNLRKEVTKMDKYFFYDLGVRNGIIDNFKPLADRNDVGQLWENFLVVERMKRNAYLGKARPTYFWRTYTGAEVDYVEETAGRLHGYEFKWKVKKIKAPTTWLQTYPQTSFMAVTPENYLDFITYK